MSKTFITLPVAKYDDILSWDQPTIDRIMGHVYQAAMAVGCHVEEEEYLREIESKGGRIDWNRRAVLPTREQLEDVCQVLKESSPATPRAGHVRSDGRFHPVGVGNGGNMYFDWASWTAKAPTADDLIWVCRWAQGNDDVASLYHPFMTKDADILLEPIRAYAILARHCRKPVHHAQPTEPVHVVYLDRMARVVEKHRGYYQPMPEMEWVNPPFRLGGRAIRTMLARVDTGVCDVMGIGPMSVSGMSAPVTPVGAAVVAVAEILTALTVLHIMRPQSRLRAAVCTGELDLATARVKYASPRKHKQDMAVSELVRRGIGAECGHSVGYRDVNEPGLQACYEYAMQQAFFSAVDHRTCPEVGGLACGNMFSPEQAVLDIEIIKEFDELLSGFDASDEAVAIDEIVAAGFEQGHHLTTDHTIAHMREHVAISDLFYRGYPAAAEHDKDNTQTCKLMKTAREKAVADHEKGTNTDPDDRLGDELWELVIEAAAEIGSGPPPKLW